MHLSSFKKAPILTRNDTRDVQPEWVSFRGPKTCGRVYISAQKPADGS